MNKQRLILKNALIINARGTKEIASQIFRYDKMREVRLDLDKLEVKVLMSYDESYFRVINDKDIKQSSGEKSKDEIVRKLMTFYNQLLSSAMQLSPEEMENLKKQREALNKKVEESKNKTEIKKK